MKITRFVLPLLFLLSLVAIVVPAYLMLDTSAVPGAHYETKSAASSFFVAKPAFKGRLPDRILRRGTVVKLVDVVAGNGWSKVQLADGQMGHVALEDLKIVPRFQRPTEASFPSPPRRQPAAPTFPGSQDIEEPLVFPTGEAERHHLPDIDEGYSPPGKDGMQFEDHIELEDDLEDLTPGIE